MKNQQDWVAIIAEFNPFHNGHKYIIEKAKEVTGCEHVLVIMSPNFVQRGEPAIINKTVRAKFALKCGASCVVQIPTKYAVCNAEVFAMAAVNIANTFSCVKYLFFGSECGNISLISDIAEFAIVNKKDIEKQIRVNLKSGKSYINCYKQALSQYAPKALEALGKPNNILGFEYVKALKTLKSHITPLTTTRIDNDYSEKRLTGKISSATAIRANFEKADCTIPKEILAETKQQQRPNMQTFENICLFATQTHVNLEEIYNVDSELTNKIKNNPQCSYQDFITAHQTRRYCLARLARLLLHATLNITKKDIGTISAPFINVLAVNQLCVKKLVKSCKSTLILRNFKQSCEIEKRADKFYYQLTGQKTSNITIFQKALTHPTEQEQSPM